MIVMTCSDEKHFKGLDTQFLPSLRETAKFTGLVAVIDYGMTAEQKMRLKKHDVAVYAAKRQSNIIIPVQRLADYARVLGRSYAAHDRVSLLDSSDVHFQGPLTELFQKDNMVASPEVNPTRIGDNGSMKRWAHGQFGVRILQDLAQKPIINGGMIYGSVEMIRRYCEWAFTQCTQGKFRKFGGADQWILTWAAVENIWPIEYAGMEKWNYTLCCVNPDYRGGKVFDKGGGVPAVIHKNGGGGTAPNVHWEKG